jgi:hypothetical protein
VDAMEGLSDEEKADANEVFENETHRKVFVGTKKPNVRLIWLKKKIAQLSTPSSAASSKTSQVLFLLGRQSHCLMLLYFQKLTIQCTCNLHVLN